MNENTFPNILFLKKENFSLDNFYFASFDFEHMHPKICKLFLSI